MKDRRELKISENNEVLFGRLVDGLESENPAVRLSAVHYAFSAADVFCNDLDSTRAHYIQKIIEVIILHGRFETEQYTYDKKIKSSRTILENIVSELGTRIQRCDNVEPIEFWGNGFPSRQYYFPAERAEGTECSSIAIDLTAIDLSRLSVSDCGFSGVNFNSASFEGARFSRCDFSYSSFHDSSLPDSYLSGNLTGCFMRDADLSFSKISASVMGADFRNSDLTGCNANFENATLARFENCNLCRADLSGSDHNISLHLARVDSDTRFPDGSTLMGLNIEYGGIVDTDWGKVRYSPL